MKRSVFDKILRKLICRLKKKKGLDSFAINRSKFEGWLKVELIDLLIAQNYTPIPELDFIDIVVGNNTAAIELKVVITSYKYNDLNVINKTKAITDSINSIIKDIECLRDKDYKNKIIMFIVFPLSSKNNQYWSRHKSKIEIKNITLDEIKFEFSNDIPAVLYYGYL